MGTNTIFKVDKEHPVQLYLGDFDENGAVDPIIFSYYFDRYMPLGSLNKFFSQLPGLRKQFVTYEDYAKVSSFDELLPNGKDLLVETKMINELRSMVFLSKEGSYETIPLPDRLQTINVQDFFVDDVHGTIYCIGGNQELAAVLGNAMASKAVIINGFNPSTEGFNSDNWLNLPTGIDARSIIRLDNGSGLIITNNDYPYLVSWF